MNKHLIIALATSLSLAGLASCGQPQTEVLFNGKDLSGWDVTGKAQVTGNILQLYGPDTRLLLKNGDYTDFELTLEARTVEGGQGSVAFHTDASGKGYSVALDNNRQSASLYDMIPAKPQNAKPFGEWNKAKIMVYKGTVVHGQNDQNVLEYHLWTKQWTDMLQASKFSETAWPLAFELLNNCGGDNHEGYIGLQDHGDDIWFRNIRVKILD